MKKVLIIYPHWPPSNLAGVHRVRLLAEFLPRFGWEPVILCVDEAYYEENKDPDLLKITPSVKVFKSKAFRPPGKFRLIGDIGLRAFPFLISNALKIIKQEKIDAIYIPIPIYYTAVLGPFIHFFSNIPYGIDYIDPWTHGIAGAEVRFSRAWWSNKLAGLLEPFALSKVSFVTGVSSSYYQYVFDKQWVKPSIPNVGMPYGFSEKDYTITDSQIPLPWTKETEAWVYAGAYLPKSKWFYEILFKAIKQLENHSQWPSHRKVFLLGTGNYQGHTLQDMANDQGVGHLVTEIQSRFPYTHILHFLTHASVGMVIGSVEKHYTASKTFQALLSNRPVFSMIHVESSAFTILAETGDPSFTVGYNGTEDEATLIEKTRSAIVAVVEKRTNYAPTLARLEPFSASYSAKALAEVLDKVAP